MQISENKWLLAALASIVLGYVLLGPAESMTLAPILLVGGYCVLMPLHLWVRHRSDRSEGE